MLEYDKTAMEPFNILLIEDDINTIIGTKKELELMYNSNIKHVSTLLDARDYLMKNVFDLLIVDARLPNEDNGKLIEEGGVLLMKELLKGELGDKNIKTNFIILSAQATSLQKESLKRYSSCKGIYGKLSPQDVIDLFEEITGRYANYE